MKFGSAKAHEGAGRNFSAYALSHLCTFSKI
jgi:hypothetical protein